MTTTSKVYLQRLKEHASNHITHILDILGVRYTQRGQLIQACCPCKNHGGDANNPTAFSWRLNYKHWVCWTHHCEEEYGNDVFGLVRGVRDFTFAESVKLIETILRDRQVDVDEEPNEEAPVHNATQPRVHAPVDEQCVRFLERHHPYMNKRKLDQDILRRYEVGYWHRLGTFMHERIVFPVRDDKGILVGFTGRTIWPSRKWDEKKVKAKWVHGRRFDRWPSENEFFSGSILFNLFRAKNHLGDDRTIILVEGPLDGLRLEEAGIKNWCAIFGGGFTAAHRTMLVQYGVNTLVLAFDPDDSGDKARERVKRFVGDLFHIRQVDLEVDPGDMEIPDIHRKFNEA